MSQVSEQAVLDAPLEEVWELVGDPRRYPEWLPRVVEVNGERFEEGAEFIQVTDRPMLGREDIPFVIDRMRELHEIRMHCTLSGMYVQWQLTEAQGGTFLQAEFGMDPVRRRDQIIDATIGRRYFRRWLLEAVEGLKRAARSEPAAH